MSDSPEGRTELPLFSGRAGSGAADLRSLEYDEDGSLALARALDSIRIARAATTTSVADTTNAIGAGDLNGSWYLQLRPQGPHPLAHVRGPMRIEVMPPRLRISGDIYVRPSEVGGNPIGEPRPITERPMLSGRNWYPHLPIDEYSWYFRSLGVTYEAGKLVFKIERHLWNRTTQEFINQENSGKDNGFMQFNCDNAVFTHPLLPQPTLKIVGTAHIGGDIYDAVATKTSPYYRGCAVEVDAMARRRFPLNASTILGASISFESIYRTAGMDCVLNIDETDLPEDAQLSMIELNEALSAHRRPVGDTDTWRLWLLVGSAQKDLFGVMFDDVLPYREGTAGFFDPVLGNLPIIAESARNKELGDVAEAFLRTLVHEAGHAFNLYHPKDDVHSVAIGTTIMNQTGDVLKFATVSNPYPHNVTFAFDDHNRTSLVHSPDPQVAPGWKRFGWGHGSLATGVAEPVDAMGFLGMSRQSQELSIRLTLPEVVFRGEFVTAQFVLTNESGQARNVTTAINLSQGDLRLLVKPPHEELHDVRDIIIACGDRALVTLEAGQSITGLAQIFYTNVGFTFRQTGRYVVSAELDPGDKASVVVRSEPVTVVVRAPATPEETDIARLSLQPGVGRAFAFGDFGMDDAARDSLQMLADRYGHTESGIAAHLTLANAHSRDLRVLKGKRKGRSADRERAMAHFSRGVEAAAGDLTTIVRMAAAVAAATEGDAPVLEMAHDYLGQRAETNARGAASLTAPSLDTAERSASPASAALDLLRDIRRTFVRSSRQYK